MSKIQVEVRFTDKLESIRVGGRTWNPECHQDKIC